MLAPSARLTEAVPPPHLTLSLKPSQEQYRHTEGGINRGVLEKSGFLAISKVVVKQSQ